MSQGATSWENRDLVCPSSPLLNYKVTFPKVSAVLVPVTHQVGPEKSVISARPKKSDDSLWESQGSDAHTYTHADTHMHARTPACREGGAVMQRWGHIQRFMVTAWELSHQIHFAQWFWQRLSRSSLARTGMTPDCDHAMATVVHQWFPSTPTRVSFTQTTGKRWSLVRLAKTTITLSVEMCSLTVAAQVIPCCAWENLKLIPLLQLYGALNPICIHLHDAFKQFSVATASRSRFRGASIHRAVVTNKMTNNQLPMRQKAST